MSIDNLLQLFERLNKPLHFCVVGVFLILWEMKFPTESKIYVFVGIVFILLATCEWITRIVKRYYSQKEYKDQKQKIIEEYHKLSDDEKAIVDKCCLDNTLVCHDLSFDLVSTGDRSLAARGFGLSQGYEFVMNKTYFEILQPYIQEQYKSRQNAKK